MAEATGRLGGDAHGGLVSITPAWTISRPLEDPRPGRVACVGRSAAHHSLRLAPPAGRGLL